MGADSLAENTPNALEFICPICLPKPKNSGFQWASLVRGHLRGIWTDVSEVHEYKKSPPEIIQSRYV